MFNEEKSATSSLFCFIKRDEYVDIDSYLTEIRLHHGAVRKVFLKSLNRKMISLLLNYFNYNIEHINDPRRVAVFFAHPFDLLSQKSFITHAEYTDVVIQYTELVEAVKVVKRK